MPNLASSVPGSAIIGSDGSIINLMHVKGMPSTKLELVRQKLKALNENIVLDVVPGNAGMEKAILSGRVPSTGFIAKAINIASLFYGEPGLRVLNGPAGNAVRDQGTEDFQTAEAFSDNMDVNLLQGMVVTDNSGNVVSLLEVNKRPQVRCRVKILDVSRNATDVLGVPFVQYLGGTVQLGADLTPPSAPAANAAGLRNLKGVSGSIVGANSLNVTLQALQEKQIVNSLAEPTLTMLSGEKASFLAGGEIPIPISDANGRITLEYREFGVRLNIIATVTDENKIHLQVAPEVSSIDPALAFNSQLISIPGIRSRRIQTTVEMLPGQNFVLGGLFSSEDTRSFSQFPGLGNIPILGNFFRTNLNDGTDSELVVLIQPEIITAEEVATAK
jgi:Flp pilus assembly secretin CpaC